LPFGCLYMLHMSELYWNMVGQRRLSCNVLSLIHMTSMSLIVKALWTM
jgi:hypothetical protein